jgi:hypothetical protein
MSIRATITRTGEGSYQNGVDISQNNQLEGIFVVTENFGSGRTKEQ